MDNSDIGNRMKRYESSYRLKLPIRMPMVIRLDGKSFSKYTKGFEKPFDMKIINSFNYAVKEGLFTNIQGLKLAYIQSDEVNLFVHDYGQLNTQSWFDRNVQKVASVSSSILTAYFNEYMKNVNKINKIALFDSRVFVLPEEEVCNMFIWRMFDAERNSISSLAQSKFSHKQLHGKNCKQMKEMLKDIGIDWDEQSDLLKRGFCVEKGIANFSFPRFNTARDYVNKYFSI